jgi:hypothetical protein
MIDMAEATIWAAKWLWRWVFLGAVTTELAKAHAINVTGETAISFFHLLFNLL